MVGGLPSEAASDPAAQQVANNNWHQVVENQRTQTGADEDAAPDSDLSTHGGSNQLLVHLKWIEGEVQAADGRRQIRLSVGAVTGGADLVLLGELHGCDVDADVHVTVVNNLFNLGLLVLLFLSHGKPEAFTIRVEFKRLGALFLHVVVKVLLVDAKGALSQLSILKGLSQVDVGRTNDVIALEEISIISLNCKVIMRARILDFEIKAVVETGFARLTSVVSVGFKRILFAVEEGPNVNVGSTFNITHLNVSGVEYADTHLELLGWLGSDIINSCLLLWCHVYVIDFNPHFQGTLSHSRAWILKFSKLDWFLFNGTPFG